MTVSVWYQDSVYYGHGRQTMKSVFWYQGSVYYGHADCMIDYQD